MRWVHYDIQDVASRMYVCMYIVEKKWFISKHWDSVWLILLRKCQDLYADVSFAIFVQNFGETFVKKYWSVPRGSAKSVRLWSI